MRAAIFTEGSSTTSKSTESYSEFFEGSFLSVNTLADDLSGYCDTEIHVLSETYGYVEGKMGWSQNRLLINLSPQNASKNPYFLRLLNLMSSFSSSPPICSSRLSPQTGRH